MICDITTSLEPIEARYTTYTSAMRRLEASKCTNIENRDLQSGFLHVEDVILRILISFFVEKMKIIL